MRKKALITGVTGQDGPYLAKLLLEKDYEVHGIKRRSSSFNTERIDHLYQDPHEKNRNFILHYGDVTDAISVSSLIKKIKPDEIYNLAAQSHVAVSFEVPEYTANADALGALRILEAIRFNNLEKKTFQKPFAPKITPPSGDNQKNAKEWAKHEALHRVQAQTSKLTQKSQNLQHQLFNMRKNPLFISFSICISK